MLWVRLIRIFAGLYYLVPVAFVLFLLLGPQKEIFASAFKPTDGNTLLLLQRSGFYVGISLSILVGLTALLNWPRKVRLLYFVEIAFGVAFVALRLLRPDQTPAIMSILDFLASRILLGITWVWENNVSQYGGLFGKFGQSKQQ